MKIQIFLDHKTRRTKQNNRYRIESTKIALKGVHAFFIRNYGPVPVRQFLIFSGHFATKSFLRVS